jgi:hypothetical protein
MVTGQVKFLRFTDGHMIILSQVPKEDFIPQTVPLSATPESNLPHEQELVKVGEEIIADEEADLVANESKES